MMALLLLLSLFQPAFASNRAVMENIAATNGTILVDTANVAVTIGNYIAIQKAKLSMRSDNAFRIEQTSATAANNYTKGFAQLSSDGSFYASAYLESPQIYSDGLLDVLGDGTVHGAFTASREVRLGGIAYGVGIGDITSTYGHLNVGVGNGSEAYFVNAAGNGVKLATTNNAHNSKAQAFFVDVGSFTVLAGVNQYRSIFADSDGKVYIGDPTLGISTFSSAGFDTKALRTGATAASIEAATGLAGYFVGGDVNFFGYNQTVPTNFPITGGDFIFVNSAGVITPGPTYSRATGLSGTGIWNSTQAASVAGGVSGFGAITANTTITQVWGVQSYAEVDTGTFNASSNAYMAGFSAPGNYDATGLVPLNTGMFFEDQSTTGALKNHQWTSLSPVGGQSDVTQVFSSTYTFLTNEAFTPVANFGSIRWKKSLKRLEISNNGEAFHALGSLTGTASLDFGATAGGTCDDLTITVTGAADGDTVNIGVPNALASSDASASFVGFVSATNTVTIRRCCDKLAGSCTNPSAATVRADVWQH